jgi:hypothetical protein
MKERYRRHAGESVRDAMHVSGCSHGRNDYSKFISFPILKSVTLTESSGKCLLLEMYPRRGFAPHSQLMLTIQVGFCAEATQQTVTLLPARQGIIAVMAMLRCL